MVFQDVQLEVERCPLVSRRSDVSCDDGPAILLCAQSNTYTTDICSASESFCSCSDFLASVLNIRLQNLQQRLLPRGVAVGRKQL